MYVTFLTRPSQYTRCDTINRLQTTQQSDRPTGRSGAIYVPPELPPNLFTVPEKHQVVPSLRAPEARSDLEALLRLSNDSICASMGCPASIIFEGKFSSNSMSQLQV